MGRDDLLAHMRRLGACSEATRWVTSQDGSAYNLWRRCDRGDWLLCLAERAGVDRRVVALAARDCAEMSARVRATAYAAIAAVDRGVATAYAACAAMDAARARSLAECARLVRRRILWSVVRHALGGGKS